MPKEKLDRRLLMVAALVWRKTRPLGKLAYLAKGDRINERELRHFARVSAFLAYMDCGGESGAYDAFDWHTNAPRVMKRAHHHMLRLLRHADRTLGLDKTRRKRRKEFVVVDQYRWDAWEQPLRNRNRGRLHNGYLPVADVPDRQVLDKRRREYREVFFAPERELQERLVSSLPTRLAVLATQQPRVTGVATTPRVYGKQKPARSKQARVRLSGRDIELLIRHYIEGEPQRSLARTLKMTENALNVVLHRARARARKLLERDGPQWQELATAFAGGAL